MSTSLVTRLISPMKLLSTSNELKVDERNKHNELNKVHIQNGLIRVQRTDIQAPMHDTAFTHGRAISTLRMTTTARVQYEGQ